MKKIISIAVAVCMIVTLVPVQAFAKIKTAGTPDEVMSLVSSEKLQHNFVNITSNGNSLSIECETPIYAEEFNISVKRVNPSTESIWIQRAYPENKGDYYYFESTIYPLKFGDGDYVLQITMPPAEPSENRSDMFYKNCAFRVKGGNFTILQYDKVIAENIRVQKLGAKVSPGKFKKKDLSDIKSLVFKDPVTKKVAKITSKRTNYFKTVSNSVTKGAKTDYEKVLKIYEYITENFYYDDIAFATGTKQYVDPYRNLYNLRNKKKSANSEKGKVATVCVGYSAVMIALARAQGIPARIVNGHHVGLSSKYNNWTTEKEITKLDHWWAEVYVDGRWMVVDPTPGNSNKWNRTTNKWSYSGTTNYIFFDPTPEQLATSHLYFQIKGVN